MLVRRQKHPCVPAKQTIAAGHYNFLRRRFGIGYVGVRILRHGTSAQESERWISNRFVKLCLCR